MTKDRMRTQGGEDQERVLGEEWADGGEREVPAEEM